ncbi:MAG: enoyl-CoA hydratase/isomerase family protein [Syntrophobacterales bacterium]|jgi:enoyl-CoA hydratase/carnithine racemase|nr:enoyl-CoA hydratase/isomerase family protein [Syntrophobacterales bacterium]
MTSYKTILLEQKSENYVVVTLNRPGELNALSRSMREELTSCFQQLETMPALKAVVLTGGDFTFSSGGDIKEMTALREAEVELYFDSIHTCLRQIIFFPRPVIAAVSGLAIGGGLNLAVSCDLIAASETAIFSHPELRFGMNPLLSPLQRRVGIAKAKEIALLGEPIPANEALRIGLINKVTPPERLMEEAEDMAREISKRSAKAIEVIKKTSNAALQMDLNSTLALEFELSSFLFARPERRNYMRDFLLAEDMRKRKRRL